MATEMCEISSSSWEDSTKENRMEKSLKVLTSLAKRPEVDVEFRDLIYMVDDGSEHGKKNILNGISGAFHTGELSVILGPSGAGKTSLLNILVGYSSIGVTGDIFINGESQDLQVLHKLSCYIMQENLMQKSITVEEAMHIAAELKLGNELNSQDKLRVIDEILDTLGLVSCRGVRTENLSGGERKRLSIALELVNNPPIIFLDEPTSGLDIVSMNRCIDVLRHLAHCGRTIICTIHQPSASVLSLFDKIYILGNGKCVYQGEPKNLVPFMTKAGFECPLTHNPADFIIETLHTDDDNVDTLSTANENGKKCEGGEASHISPQENDRSRQTNLNVSLDFIKHMEFSSSFYKQFTVILKRMMLQKSRDKTALLIQMINHFLMLFLLSGIYFNVGSNPEADADNFRYCLSMLVFFSFTYVSTLVLTYPTEFQLLRREYFNRWYSLKAYYAALTISNIPTMFVLGIAFCAISYYISGQLLEFDRFILFTMVCILTSYCSEGFGLIFGSIFHVRLGALIAPALGVPLMGLCIFGLGYSRRVGFVMKTLMLLSYLRVALVAICVSVYQNREPMDCPNSPYCYSAYPKVVLRDLGMGESSYWTHMLGLLFYTIIFRVMAYICIRYRLQMNFNNKILKYISRYVRYK